MRLANMVAEKVGPAYEHVTAKVVPISREIAAQVGPMGTKAYERARHGAETAYRVAMAHPRTSIAGVVVAAAVIGGLLWYMFGDRTKPVERRRKGARVRAVSEKRRRNGRQATA